MMLHRCGHAGRVSAPVAEAPGAAAVVRRGKRSVTVDVHAHAFVPEVEQLVAGRPEKLAEPELQRRFIGAASYEHNLKHMLPTAGPKLTSVELRLKDMDAMGIDVQLVSPTSTQHYYWADHDLARAIVRTTNERIAETCARHPDRLVALGNIALQHPELAVEQLTHCLHTLGMKASRFLPPSTGASWTIPCSRLSGPRRRTWVRSFFCTPSAHRSATVSTASTCRTLSASPSKPRSPSCTESSAACSTGIPGSGSSRHTGADICRHTSAARITPGRTDPTRTRRSTLLPNIYGASISTRWCTSPKACVTWSTWSVPARSWWEPIIRSTWVRTILTDWWTH